MSAFFPVHRPRVGVSFTERGIALVELQSRWGRTSLTRISERPLPEGVLRASAGEPNMLDRSAVEKELSALLKNMSERTVAVCLPDRTCHLAVFAFETVPARERDRDPILRWRFQHESHMAVGDARIFHRVFPVHETAKASKSAPPQEGRVEAYVLAMAIKRSVLEQYEQLCLQVGLLPLSISCASLWLFDFYRPAIAQAEELFFVHQASDSMTFFAFKQGRPVFCRTKSWRHEQGGDVMPEIRSTMQFYEDLHPSLGTTGGAVSVPIYMVGAGLSPCEEIADKTSGFVGKHEEKTMTWKGKPILPDWKALVLQKNCTISSEAGLSALACVGGR